MRDLGKSEGGAQLQLALSPSTKAGVDPGGRKMMFMEWKVLVVEAPPTRGEKTTDAVAAPAAVVSPPAAVASPPAEAAAELAAAPAEPAAEPAAAAAEPAAAAEVAVAV